VPETDDVVAVVTHRRRREDARQPQAAVGRLEPVDRLARDIDVDGRAAFSPVGKELVERARLEHGARENVGADLRTLLENADARLDPFGCGKLP